MVTVTAKGQPRRGFQAFDGELAAVAANDLWHVVLLHLDERARALVAGETRPATTHRDDSGHSSTTPFC